MCRSIQLPFLILFLLLVNRLLLTPLLLLPAPLTSDPFISFLCFSPVFTFSDKDLTCFVYFEIGFIFISDPLSWIPHECYKGKECKPRIGSCFKYSEYRECCCDRILAEECKSHSQPIFTRKPVPICVLVVRVEF